MESIGKYLERNVIFMKSNEIVDSDLKASLILVCFEKVELMAMDRVIKMIIKKTPMGIAIYKEKRAFDSLLRNLQYHYDPQFHITTQYISENNLDDFFFSNWPVESRFDDWNNYVVIISGNEKFYKKIKAEILKKDILT